LPGSGSGGTPKIGYFAAGSADDPLVVELLSSFRDGLRELGLTIPPAVLGQATNTIQ
jgi:hypothetical protein